MQYGDLILSGNDCILDRKTHNGVIEGDVRLKLPMADFKARKMEFNLGNGLGTLSEAQGIFNNQLTFSAGKIERTGVDTFRIEDGSITTCPADNQEWVFKARSLNVKMEGIATLRDASMRFYDVPIFYTPIWFAPAVTKRTSGLLMPGVGYDSLNGAFIKNSFYWAKSEQDDATLYLDLMEKRGVHEGLEYRYAFAERTRGQMNLDYIQDSLVKDTLYSVKYNHRQQFTDDLEGMANIDLESRTSYTKEFDTSTFYNTRRYTDSSVNVRSAQDIFYASLTGRDQREIETVPTEVFTRRPEMTVAAMPHHLFGTAVVADAQVKAGTFYSSANGDLSVDRAFVSPTLAIPFSVGGTFNLNPYVSGKSVFYSRSATDPSPLNTVYYSAGVGLEGPRAYRIFGDGENAYKHTITPMLDYGYLPGYEVDGANRKNALQLDPSDNSTPKNLLTFSLLNRVFSKRSGGDEVVRFIVSQGYDFNEAARTDTTDKRPLTPLTAELKSRPFPWLLLNADIAYNHYDRQPETNNQEVGISTDSSFYLSYNRSYNRLSLSSSSGGIVGFNPGYPTSPLTTSTSSSFSSGLIGYKLTSAVSTEISAIYDEILHRPTGSLFLMKYESCCWGVSLTVGNRVRTLFLPDGTLRDETETKFYFSINLKGIGDIGEKPVPLIPRKL